MKRKGKNNMYEIKKINVLSAARIFTFIVCGSYIVWGLLFGGIITMFSGFYYYSGMFGYGGFPFIGILIGVAVSAGVGFGMGALLAFIYNLVASWLGGIKMDLELVSDGNNYENQNNNSTPNAQQN